MNKVLDSAFDLGRTRFSVGAKMLGFTLLAFKWRTAVGAVRCKFHFGRARRSLGPVDARDFRDDLATLFYPNPITEVQIKFGNLVGVVHRRTLDLGTTQPNGV